jgi:hypothetical protein
MSNQLGSIRFAHEPFRGGLQRISNLRNFVAVFFMSNQLGIIRFAHEPFWGGLQRFSGSDPKVVESIKKSDFCF